MASLYLDCVSGWVTANTAEPVPDTSGVRFSNGSYYSCGETPSVLIGDQVYSVEDVISGSAGNGIPTSIQLLAPEATITSEDFATLSGGILSAFVIAWGIRVIIKRIAPKL